MISLTKEYITVEREQDVILLRKRLKEMALSIDMTLLNQTKLITAASELVRNMLKYAKKGNVIIEIISVEKKIGIKITFEDKGPGIENLNLAMKDGYSTSKGLGLGLPGARRLVNEFKIESTLGVGTTIIIIKWKIG